MKNERNTWARTIPGNAKDVEKTAGITQCRYLLNAVVLVGPVGILLCVLAPPDDVDTYLFDGRSRHIDSLDVREASEIRDGVPLHCDV